eukprot:6643266-Prymnesium_polylepis.1
MALTARWRAGIECSWKLRSRLTSTVFRAKASVAGCSFVGRPLESEGRNRFTLAAMARTVLSRSTVTTLSSSCSRSSARALSLTACNESPPADMKLVLKPTDPAGASSTSSMRLASPRSISVASPRDALRLLRRCCSNASSSSNVSSRLRSTLPEEVDGRGAGRTRTSDGTM